MSMHSTEELEKALQGAGQVERLGGPDLARIRRDGARRRTARRLAAGGGVVAAAALVGVVLVGTSLGGNDTGARPDRDLVGVAPTAGATALPTGAELDSLLAGCRDGNQSDRATRAIFGGGEPVVKAAGVTEHRASLALESAEGDFWAQCEVAQDKQEFAATMTVWPTQGTTTDSGYGFGPGCGIGTEAADCGTFAVTWVDRRPAVVAAAEFTTADGRTTRVESRDGYLVFEYLAPVPDGMELGEMGPQVTPLRRVTFLDAAGDPIAAEVLDGTGGGPDGERVEGLPSITAYPGLRGDTIG
jgi:hypothetical protein